MRSRLLIPALVTVPSLAVLIGLGAWQWQRMGEKHVLIATVQERSIQTPEAFPAADRWASLDLASLAYRPVTVSGTFDHGREAHVFFSLAKPVNGVGGPGYLIVTPLLVEGGGVVLINRGFVPADRKEPASRQPGQAVGPVTLTGLIRLPEARNRFAGENDPAKNVFYLRNPDEIARAKRLDHVAPVLIDQRAPMPEGRLPMPGVTQIDIPNNHFQYALTWWSLAGCLAAIFALFARAKPDQS
ncbi:MAG TPA: SURF1 family protein [Beijerinckiaceae bacterium]|nr:SURF1 family protein [Beijerinckiaceae bacterium]